MQLLVIRTNGLNGKPEYALLGKKQSQDRFTPADWKRISSLTRGRRILMLIPNEDVSLTSINIPSQNKKQLLQAAPFALEDSLTEDIEDLHFSIYQDANSNNLSHVGIINRSTLASYVDKARSHGITPHFVLPELLIQHTQADSWSIIGNNLSSDSKISVRLASFNGFSCPESLLDMFISEQLETQAPKLIFSNIAKEYLPSALQDIPYEPIDSGLIHSASVISALPLNLLTNFVAKTSSPVINWKAWRPVAVLGSLLAAVWVSVFIWQNNVLQQQNDGLTQQIEQVYKSVFPKSRLVDPAVQMNSALKKLKLNSGKTIDSPLPLISTISPLLKEFKDMNLSEVRYQENQLSFIMQAPSLTRLESFKKEAAKKMKLNVEIKSSTTTANKVEATLIISPMENSTATKPIIKSQENA